MLDNKRAGWPVGMRFSEYRDIKRSAVVRKQARFKHWTIQSFVAAQPKTKAIAARMGLMRWLRLPRPDQGDGGADA